ncbi:hypothetical protein ACFY4H_25320 [Streptomyces althioticus]|uniref:hypothetical protein n=1 Tax=Streptomyces althioticus TaxID=83380 RepID=UPI003693B37A
MQGKNGMIYVTLAVGVILGCVSIVVGRRFGDGWLFAATVILLPLVYAAFALVNGDPSTALLELLVGLPFVVGGITGLLFRRHATVLLVGGLWVIHAVFDGAHDLLYANPAVPRWYPTLCAAIDLTIGIYLLWVTVSFRESWSNRSRDVRV